MSLRRTIENEVISYFEWLEKIQSGNLGYKTNTSFEPGTQNAGKSDPTPNQGVPAELVFIDSVIMEMDKEYKAVLKQKLLSKHDIDERARQLFMSPRKYHYMCKEVMAYLKGCYRTHYSTRRQQKYPRNIDRG